MYANRWTSKDIGINSIPRSRSMRLDENGKFGGGKKFAGIRAIKGLNESMLLSLAVPEL